MTRGGWALAALLCGCGGVVTVAQAAPPPVVAVPYYTPQDYAAGLQRHALAPRAAAFAAASARLAPALHALCTANAAASAPALQHARAQWADSVTAWELLSSVALGPLLERRSARQIDFAPPRPALIERAIAAAPRDADAMARIGSPAKGLPALEWLLWTQPVEPATPACGYAEQVAADIEREARALSDAWAGAAAPEEASAGAALAEALNQWIGGLEALRWRHMERPLHDAAPSARDPAVFPRHASGRTAASWAAQWQALRSLAVAGPGAAPAPGAGLLPFETYLRGRGLNPLADTLRARVADADARIAGLQPGERAHVLDAAAALGALKQWAESELAPALQVSIGFSDADGD